MAMVLRDVLELEGEGVRVQVSLQGASVVLEVAVVGEAAEAGLAVTRRLELRAQDAVRLGRTVEAWGKQLRAVQAPAGEGA